MRNILIVDDNRMILDSLSSFLSFKLKDCNVLTAEGGEKAIEVLRLNQVSLILTDLEMPNVDGYEVIEYAKKNCPSAPVIIMVGSWSLDLEMLVHKTGVIRFIEKPFRFEDLEQIVTETLEQGTKTSRIIASSEQTMENILLKRTNIPEHDSACR